MRALSIRHKLMLACGVMALITGTMGAGALWTVASVNHAYQRLAHESLPAL